MEETIYEKCFCIGRTGGISTFGIERRRTEKAKKYWRNRISERKVKFSLET